MAEAELVAQEKEAAKERQRAGGGDKRSPKARAEKTVPQTIGEPINPHARETDSRLAAAHGTNLQCAAGAEHLRGHVGRRRTVASESASRLA